MKANDRNLCCKMNSSYSNFFFSFVFVQDIFHKSFKNWFYLIFTSFISDIVFKNTEFNRNNRAGEITDKNTVSICYKLE